MKRGSPPVTRSSATRRAPAQLEKVFAAFPYPLLWIAREQMPYEREEDREHLAEGFSQALEYAAT